jgi:lipoprotein-anchoring transpeptidase ErfK/SrfK
VTRSAAALAVALLLATCGGDDGSEGAGAPSESTATAAESAEDLPPDSSWVAQAKEGVAEVPVYAEPDAAEPIHQLTNPTRVDDAGNTAPLVFLVDGLDVSGEWLPVHLPVPPNGSTGFVRQADVELYSHDYRITVRLAEHHLTLTQGGEPILEATVGLGRAGRETPAGLYFVTELLEAPDPGGVYGPYAYGISGFQDDPEVRSEFGGEAVIGIHGTNEPDLLGQAVSSGCIRVSNDVITEMAEMLPLGVPVELIA